MNIAILTFEGFNEIDSFVSHHILTRVDMEEWNVASAGGCLAAPYLAAWVIARLLGGEAAEKALRIVAPVGEKAQYVAGILAVVSQFVRADAERVA